MLPRNELAALQSAFIPPPGLGRSLPREVTLTAGGWVVRVAAVSLVALAIVVFVALSRAAGRQADDRRLLRDTGVDATAEVTRLWRSGEKSHEPRVAYRFWLGGQLFEGSSTIGFSHWRMLGVGSRLPIRFPDGHPDKSLARGVESQAMPLWLPFVVSAAIGAGGFGCLFWLNLERRLVSIGRAAPAIVTRVKKHHSSHGGGHWQIRYEFRLLSGASAAGTSRTQRKPPVVGTVICVLYDPDRPRRSLPYPVRLARPAVLRNP
jgi:hypothetical protein